MKHDVARLFGGGLAAAALTLGFVSVAAPPAQAASFEVDSLTDDGVGLTLREAIEAANADADADTITFAQPGTVTLAGELPWIDTTVTIDATAVGGVTVDAAGTGRVFRVIYPGNLTVDQLTITGGAVNAGEGGGILVQDGVLTVRDSTISGNTALLGGGILTVDAELMVTGSTISGNTAGAGGGLYLLYSPVTVVENSTIAHNAATAMGGGLFVRADPDVGDDQQVAVRHSTLAYNTAGQGAQVIFEGGSEVTFSDSVAVVTSGDLCDGVVSDGGGNLSWPADPDCPGLNADPLLGALADNGGPTATMAPGVGSPAIDAAAGIQPATDQRGLPRPQGAGGDAGAFEVQAPSIVGMPPAGLVGTGYSYGFMVTGDPAPSLPAPTVSVTTGSLPPGLSLSSAGVLSGTPTTAGSFSFTATAANAGGSASVPVTVTISPANTSTKADLAVTLTAPSSVPIGQAYAYQASTKNTGPATATTVYTVLVLPDGTQLQSATAGYTQVGQVLYWQAASLAKNATVSYTATVTATSKGNKVAGAAGVSVTTPDPKPLNNLTAKITKITN